MSKTNTLEAAEKKPKQWQNFIAGLMAGFISVTVCNPLDIARTRLNALNAPTHKDKIGKYTHFSHAMKTIWKEQGWRGFYSGYQTNVVAIPIFHSLFFPIYEKVKQVALDNNFSLQSASICATTVSGSVCNILTNPIWVVRTRLMTQYLHHEDHHYKTGAPFKVIKEMYEKEGFRSLFKGLTASLFSVSNAIIYFVIYEEMKKALGATTVSNIFIASTVSKVIASTSTYPFVAIRTVMFDSRGPDNVLKFMDVTRHIMKDHGFFGFYAGLKPDLIRLIPSNAIVFIVYQILKKHL